MKFIVRMTVEPPDNLPRAVPEKQWKPVTSEIQLAGTIAEALEDIATARVWHICKSVRFDIEPQRTAETGAEP
jgi:hypothetical protein